MKVCFISCHYPPLSRTYRRYQFARLLADGGCDVEVIAHGNVSRAMGSFTDDPDTVAADGPPVHRPRAVAWHLTGEALYAAGFIACPHVNWVRPAVRAACRIARGPEDVVVGIYPPLTNLIVAWRTAQATGARLVVDFRDEYLGLVRGRLQRRWAHRWEARLRQDADLVSVATEAVGRGFLERGLPASRLQMTANGYWDLPVDLPGYTPGPVCRVVYVGALSAAQQPEILCQAMERLQRDSPAQAARLAVDIYGPDNRYARRALHADLPPGCSYGGYLPAGEVSRVLTQADVGFLSLASDAFAYAVPGKVYDYIAHERPVLASLPCGAASELIEGEDIGLVAPCGDVAGLSRQLARLTDAALRAHLHARVAQVRPRHAGAPNFLALSRRIQSL